MSNALYRVILTGELLPGHSSEKALVALADLFNTPLANLRDLLDGNDHPVEQSLEADEALALQERLGRIGVGCRIERCNESKLELRLREEKAPGSAISPAASSVQPGLMKCPACAHQQLVAQRCDACGIEFADYHRRKRNAPGPATRAPAAKAKSLGNPAGNQAADVWRDFVDDREPDERDYLTLFFGEQADEYLTLCDKHLRGPRTRFGLGWCWGAVLSPFIWALYRKMWGWALVIFVCEIFLPVLLITLGSYELPTHKLAWVGYAGLIANRLFWPAILDFLYCRHARQTLRRLHMMSPNYAAEIDIATAGGTSTSSVLVGVVLAVVMSLFLWSLVDSVYNSSQLAIQQRLVKAESAPRVAPVASAQARSQIKADTAAVEMDEQNAPVANKWIATRTRLTSLGRHIDAWLDQHAAKGDTSQLNLFRLRQEAPQYAALFVDGWGGDVQYIPDAKGYRLISAGPDRLFGSADDLQLRRKLAP